MHVKNEGLKHLKILEECKIMYYSCLWVRVELESGGRKEVDLPGQVAVGPHCEWVTHCSVSSASVSVAQLCPILCSPMDCSPPLSVGFSRQEYWSRLPFPSLGHIPDPGIKPGSLALQADSLLFEPPGKPLFNGNLSIKCHDLYIYIYIYIYIYMN